MKTLQLLNLGSEILKKNNISSHLIDSEIILSKILNISREKLLTNQSIVNLKNIAKFKSKIEFKIKKNNTKKRVTLSIGINKIYII